MYIIRFSKQADKDKKSLKEAGLDSKAKNLLNESGYIPRPLGRTN